MSFLMCVSLAFIAGFVLGIIATVLLVNSQTGPRF